MVECAALEMRCTGNRTVGSNPTLSASHLFPCIAKHRLKGGIGPIFGRLSVELSRCVYMQRLGGMVHSMVCDSGDMVWLG